VIVFSGCRSITPPVNYYILNPLTATPASSMAVEGKRHMRVGIRPIVLPGYINRAHMVRRTGQNQLEVSSLNRWADHPDRMIQRVIGENLQLLLDDARVFSASWPMGLKPDVVVDLAFLELIGTKDKRMLLSAVWAITGKGDLSVARSHRTTYSEKIPGTGFDDLAAAHNRALEALCREIADTLNAFPTQ
jgi:hypothetical protein